MQTAILTVTGTAHVDLKTDTDLLTINAKLVSLKNQLWTQPVDEGRENGRLDLGSYKELEITVISAPNIDHWKDAQIHDSS